MRSLTRTILLTATIAIVASASHAQVFLADLSAADGKQGLEISTDVGARSPRTVIVIVFCVGARSPRP